MSHPDLDVVQRLHYVAPPHGAASVAGGLLHICTPPSSWACWRTRAGGGGRKEWFLSGSLQGGVQLFRRNKGRNFLIRSSCGISSGPTQGFPNIPLTESQLSKPPAASRCYRIQCRLPIGATGARPLPQGFTTFVFFTSASSTFNF